MNNRMLSPLLRLMPKRTYTTLLGLVARASWSRHIVPWYANHFKINTQELSQPLSEYQTLESFFSRQLRAGARCVETDVVSPVDGTVSTFGDIVAGELLQVKGKSYTVAELLADTALAAPFQGGQYITLYLSPRDYHRIHAPVDCEAKTCRHIPGTLFPVNQHGVEHISRLFVRNERLVTLFTSSAGDFALVKVGAAGVGTVVVPYAAMRSRKERGRGAILSTTCDCHFTKGDELGYFTLGSTVVLLFSPAFRLRFAVETGQSVRMGQRIAKKA